MTNRDDEFDHDEDFEHEDEFEREEPSVDDALPDDGLRPIAYVRPLTSDERRQAPEGVRGADAVALHDEDGRPLALFPDRASAFAAAMVNDFEPVSVH